MYKQVVHKAKSQATHRDILVPLVDVYQKQREELGPAHIGNLGDESPSELSRHIKEKLVLTELRLASCKNSAIVTFLRHPEIATNPRHF